MLVKFINSSTIKRANLVKESTPEGVEELKEEGYKLLLYSSEPYKGEDWPHRYTYEDIGDYIVRFPDNQ